jgi:hypothetical protein
MFLLNACLLLSLADSSAANAAHIARLVQQLGADGFKDRETASETLQDIGEVALPALRAAGGSNDAEVRSRARRLVDSIQERTAQEQVQAIRASALSAKDKGRRLRASIKPGITLDRVTRLIGPGQAIESRGNPRVIMYYPDRALIIDFDVFDNTAISRRVLGDR